MLENEGSILEEVETERRERRRAIVRGMGGATSLV